MLVVGLLEVLKASAPSRVVVLSSEAHRGATMRWDDVQMSNWRGKGWTAYCQSKLANLLFVRDTAPELEGVSGEYFSDRAPVPPSREARDNDAARRLWALSEELTA